MSIRYVSLFVLLVLRSVCHAEVTGRLSLLKNEWGKGCPMDFRKKVYETVPEVLKNGGDAEVVEWYQDIVSYPDLIDAKGATSWIHEKVDLLLTQAMLPPVSSSTNCWFAAAGLLNRYHGMVREAEPNANVKLDHSLMKTDPKRFNEIFYERGTFKVRLRNLQCVEKTLARVVTNEFPKNILPLLPVRERERIMGNVLAMAGLVASEKPISKASFDIARRGGLGLGALLAIVILRLVSRRFHGRSSH